MKTQQKHTTRQLQHSCEVGRARAKARYIKEIKLYQRVGWGLMSAWILWVIIIEVVKCV